MALPDMIGLKAGTPIVWTSTGGTYAITLTSLAADAGREGSKGDLGVNWENTYNVMLEVKPTSSPSDATQVELYWCQSTNSVAGSDNPGNLSGADAPVTNPAEVKRQLTFLGALTLGATIGSVVQKQRFDLYPLCRYGFPVVVNKSNVALSSAGTDHKVTLTPAITTIMD